MGRHSRDRSPKRRESDRRSSRDDKRERHSNQKDIEALKKRMKSSLNTAISDIRKLDQSDRDLPEKSHYDEGKL
jgi:uncharacterized protein with WD repeat